MTRGLAWLTAAFTASVGLLVGLVLNGAIGPRDNEASAPQVVIAPSPASIGTPAPPPLPVPGTVNFADIAERLNPVVVNIDASARGRRATVRPPGELPRRPAPAALGSEVRSRGRGRFLARGSAACAARGGERVHLRRSTNPHAGRGIERSPPAIARAARLRSRADRTVAAARYSRIGSGGVCR